MFVIPSKIDIRHFNNNKKMTFVWTRSNYGSMTSTFSSRSQDAWEVKSESVFLSHYCSFVDLLNEYLLSTYYVPGTFLGNLVLFYVLLILW